MEARVFEETIEVSRGVVDFFYRAWERGWVEEIPVNESRGNVLRKTQSRLLHQRYTRTSYPCEIGLYALNTNLRYLRV